MNAKEKLIREILALDEAEAARARIVISDEFVDEPIWLLCPRGRGDTLTGEPMLNAGAAVRRSRESHWSMPPSTPAR